MKIYIFIFAICIIAVNAEARKRKYDDNFSDYPVYNSNIRYQRGYFRKDGTYVESHYKTVSDEYKKRVLKAKDIDSTITGSSVGHPIRSLRNSMTREYQRLEKEGVEFEKLERMTLGSLRRAVIEGDVMNGTVMAGQIAGMIQDELSCKEIITSIVSEAERLMNRK